MANSNPDLTLPQSEQVAAGGVIDVSGISYSDTAAAGNSGAMYLRISDTAGTLSASDSTGVVSGSGSNTLTLTGSYSDVEAALQSLTYAAPAAAGSDSISFDLWNQYGTETTGSIPVTIGAASGGTETWTGAVSSDWNTAANWSGGAVPTDGDTVIIPGGTPNEATLSNAILTGETISLVQGGTAAPIVNFNNVVLDSILQGGTGFVNIGGTLTIGASGTVAGSASGELGLGGTAETIVNNGLIVGQSGGAVDIYNSTAGTAAANFVNAGSIIADGGKVALVSSPYPGSLPEWIVSNSGSIGITGNGGFTLNGTLDGGSVDFNGAGKLELQQAMALAGGAVVSGFGQGDQLDLYGGGFGSVSSFNNGTLDVISQAGGTVVEAIPFTGSLGLGNFGDELVRYPFSPSIIAYEPDGGASGVIEPDVSAPASASVAQGGTLGLGDVSVSGIDNSTTLVMTIDAGSGTLYMNGADGTGTHELSVTASISQLDADLASLSYVAGAAATSDTVSVGLDSNGPIATARLIPITIISSGGNGPTLTERSSETVATGGTVAVNGSYSDSFAASTPGSMFVEAIAQTGTVYATDASGQAVAGSGTNAIRLSTDYTDVNAVLHSLTYSAGASAGSDSIHLEVWNQAGVMSADDIPVTVTAGTTGGGSGPTLNEPASETVAPSGTVAVAGSYSDSFAAANPGAMYLGISDDSGTLSATDASGHAVAGSGSSSIALSTDYVDVKAILASLQYAAGASAGSDTIHFDLWNQAGVETTGSTAITVDPTGGTTSNAAIGMLDFPMNTAGPSSMPTTTNSPMGSMLTSPIDDQQPVILPFTHT